MGRAERRRRTEVVQRRRERWARTMASEVFEDSWSDPTPAQRGHWRRHHPADCGKARCVTCHGDKVLKFPRRDDGES